MTKDKMVALVRAHARNNLHTRDGYWSWVTKATDEHILSVIGDRRTPRGIIGKCADPQWRERLYAAEPERKAVREMAERKQNAPRQERAAKPSADVVPAPPKPINQQTSPDISSDLIERRLTNFWGYGSLEAPVWLVGMEEGLGDTDKFELRNRFVAGDGKQTIDIRKDMVTVPGHMKFYAPPGTLQATLYFPIALSLYIKNNRQPTKEEILRHQVYELGDLETRISSAFDLMPLPSRKADEETWLYSQCGLDSLSSRKQYLETHRPRRVAELAQMVERYKPQLIIFYSTGYKNYWMEVMGIPAREIAKHEKTNQMYFGKASSTPNTFFCIVPQRNSFGMSRERIYDFAKKIAPEIYQTVNT